MGMNNMWGFTPALDLVHTYLAAQGPQHEGEATEDRKREVNLLCVGSGDIRHALKTFAQAGRHSSVRKVNVSCPRCRVMCNITTING